MVKTVQGLEAVVLEWPTWQGRRCFVPFNDLTSAQQLEARQRFSPEGRSGGYENIEQWAFAVRKDGKLASCPFIEPVGPKLGKQTAS